jgi:hypothetical protein
LQQRQARVVEKHPARCGQRNAARPTLQELDADLELQITNLQRGLRRMQPPFRRIGEAALLGDGDEIAQMPQLHPSHPYFQSIGRTYKGFVLAARAEQLMRRGQFPIVTGNHKERPMPKQSKPSIVFVHGIWADGSSIPPLQAEGHEVIAAQHGLDSLAGDVAAVKSAIGRVSGPVILVGHP